MSRDESLQGTRQQCLATARQRCPSIDQFVWLVSYSPFGETSKGPPRGQKKPKNPHVIRDAPI
jgi:hypothetical protein